VVDTVRCAVEIQKSTVLAGYKDRSETDKVVDALRKAGLK